MVKTRIAPSPTGDPHIGTAYTALFNFAFARKNNGKFLLRIEDTDRQRLVPGAQEQIIAALTWLGLSFDDGPYKQSDRLELYQKRSKELVEKGQAYYCNCTLQRLEELRKKQQEKGEVSRYDRKCRNDPPRPAEGGSFVVRLKVPLEGETSFEDLIRGMIRFQNKDIDDAVLLKSDGWPTYHLAVVTDDSDMKITHVIRAEEWLSSTPKHVLIYKALGLVLPVYAHLPLLRNKDKSKISKRKNPVSLDWFRQEGFLPQALLNYLALMGWSMPGGKEIFGLEEFVENFDFKRVDPTGPIFDLEKLTWLNGEWIRLLTADTLADRLKDYTSQDREKILKVLPLVKERIKKLSEFNSLTNYFFSEEIDLNKDLIIQKGRNKTETASLLKKIEVSFTQLTNWDKGKIEEVLTNQVSANPSWSKTDIFQTVRAAVTGTLASPPLPETLETIGKEKILSRLASAAETLKV